VTTPQIDDMTVNAAKCLHFLVPPNCGQTAGIGLDSDEEITSMSPTVCIVRWSDT